MTISVPLTPEEEAKLNAIAKGRGVSPVAFIRSAVKKIIERSALAPLNEGEPRPDEREKHIEELFESFDSVNVPSGINEEAFHRENWYR